MTRIVLPEEFTITERDLSVKVMGIYPDAFCPSNFDRGYFESRYTAKRVVFENSTKNLGADVGHIYVWDFDYRLQNPYSIIQFFNKLLNYTKAYPIGTPTPRKHSSLEHFLSAVHGKNFAEENNFPDHLEINGEDYPTLAQSLVDGFKPYIDDVRRENKEIGSLRLGQELSKPCGCSKK